MQIRLTDEIAEKALRLAKAEGHETVTPWLRVLIKRADVAAVADKAEAAA